MRQPPQILVGVEQLQQLLQALDHDALVPESRVHPQRHRDIFDETDVLQLSGDLHHQLSRRGLQILLYLEMPFHYVELV